MSQCPYKTLFGNLGEGLHSYRIFNIAIIDVLLTLIMSYIISIYTNISFFKIVILTFILGIILHRFFCVRTTIDKLLFKN